MLSLSHVFAIVDTELKEYMEMSEDKLTPSEQENRKQVEDALDNLERLCDGETKI